MENLPSPSPGRKPVSQGYDDLHAFEPVRDDASGLKTLLNTEQGYIVGRMGDELLRYKTDAHLLTVAPTGGGKGTGLILPNLFDHPGSSFVLDIKGETVAQTATARRLKGQRVVVLDPYNLTDMQWGSDTFNPLDYISDPFGNGTDEDIEKLADALMFDPQGRSSNEPIWDNATRGLLCGLMTYVIRYGEPHKRNLRHVLDILNYDADEMEEFVSLIRSIVFEDENGKSDATLKAFYKDLTDSKSKTKITDNAIVQSRTVLKWVGNRSFENCIDRSTFSFRDMQSQPMTVYLVVPYEYIDNCAIWVRLILENAVYGLSNTYEAYGKSSWELTQNERVLFMLDEIAAFGKLKIVSNGVPVMRDRGVNLWLFIQNLSQLETTYDKAIARSIIGNASVFNIFESNELEELEYVVRMIGEEYFNVESVQIGQAEMTGSSTTKGISRGISNSVSVTEGTSRSETIGRTKTVNWNKTRGRSSNYGYTSGSGRNSGSNSGTTRPRNWLASWDSGSRNSGSSSGRSSNSSWNRGGGTSRSYSEGASDSTTHSTTTGTNYSETKGRTETFTETQSEAQNRSTTLSRNITVKMERMKLETVRSLRAKLTNQSQLLLVRGHQPFFCPRMSYRVRYSDAANRFMFPDMAALANIDNYREMAQRPTLTAGLDFMKPLFDESSIFQKLRAFLDEIDEEHDTKEEVDALGLYQKFLREVVPQSFETFQQLDDELYKQRQAFEEIAIANLTMLRIMSDADVEGFEGADQKLIDQMAMLEDKGEQVSSYDSAVIEKFSRLPITNIKQISVVRNNKDGLNISIDQEKDIHKGYKQNLDDLRWLVYTYADSIKNAYMHVAQEHERMNAIIESQDEVRDFLVQGTDSVCNNLDEVIGKALERDVLLAMEFEAQNNSF